MRHMTVRMLYLSLAAVLVVIAACGEDDIGSDLPSPTSAQEATATPAPDLTPTTVPDRAELEDTEWLLTEIDSSPSSDDTRVRLEFGNGAVSGYGGCNWYGGQYSMSGSSIDIDQGATTDRGCGPEPILEQEERYFELLREIETFELTDTELKLFNAEGVATLVFARREPAAMDPADLVGTTWQLVSFAAIPAVGPPQLLTFDDESSYSTRDGCFNYLGNYTASGDRLITQTTGPAAEVCLQPKVRHGGVAVLLNALDDVAYYRISDDGSELELIHYDGRTALFSHVTELPSDDAWSVALVLDSIIIDGEAEPFIEGTEITLNIPNPSLHYGEGQTVTGNSGCNTYQAVMTAGNETLTFTDIIVTDMGCLDPPGIMEQEQRVLELLGDVTSHNFFEENALQLVTTGGTTLVFRPGN